MLIEIEFAELHTPLFLAGTNLQLKLDPKKRTGLSMRYDDVHERFYVKYNGRMSMVPMTNVSNMIAKDDADWGIDWGLPTSFRDEPKRVASGPIKAQASTPHSHVFDGPGAGQTGQEKPRGKVVI